MADTSWSGPLFLVGLPRSGTKLLRDVLNNHPDIFLSAYETGFLPAWMATWARYGDLSVLTNFLAFYRDNRTLPYFRYRDAGQSPVDALRWYTSCRNYTIAGVFEALIRLEGTATGKPEGIWGDKSPSYVNNLDALAQHFPDFRCIHIIRDVRDQSLSMEKAWGKNKIRNAQRWVDSIARYERSAINYPGQCLSIRYEDLLEAPEHTVAEVCEFLGVDFTASLMRTRADLEPVGAGRGRTSILRTNKGKFLTELPPSQREAIEQITGRTLHAYGYITTAPSVVTRVSAHRMRAYQALDALHSFTSLVRRKGLSSSVRMYSASVLLLLRSRRAPTDDSPKP